VRVVDRKSTAAWHNNRGVVQRAWPETGMLQIAMGASASVQNRFHCSKVVLMSGKEALPLNLGFDARKVTLKQKQESFAALGGGCQYLEAGKQVEHPELLCWWLFLKQAMLLSSDREAVRKAAVYLDPGTAAVLAVEAGSSLAEANLVEWRGLLLGSRKASVEGGCSELIALPIHAGGHWTLLTWQREAGSHQFRTTYVDSLKGGSISCRSAAETLNKAVQKLISETEAIGGMHAEAGAIEEV